MDISIIIPVFHEEKFIDRVVEKLGRLLIQSKLKSEIIISDGDERATTIQSLRNRNIIPVRSRKGRGAQMNTAAALAKGDILLFLHADNELPDAALERIFGALSDPDIAGGAFSLKIDSSRFFFKLISAATNIRSRLNRIPYGDQAIFVRKSVFRELGGYKEIPLLEDVEFMRRLRRLGFRIVILRDKVSTSSRRWEKEGWFITTIRHRLIAFLYMIGLKPEWLAGIRNTE